MISSESACFTWTLCIAFQLVAATTNNFPLELDGFHVNDRALFLNNPLAANQTTSDANSCDSLTTDGKPLSCPSYCTCNGRTLRISCCSTDDANLASKQQAFNMHSVSSICFEFALAHTRNSSNLLISASSITRLPDTVDCNEVSIDHPSIQLRLADDNLATSSNEPSSPLIVDVDKCLRSAYAITDPLAYNDDENDEARCRCDVNGGNFRLPRSLQPLHYDLTFKFTFEPREKPERYDALELLKFVCTEHTDKLILHMKSDIQLTWLSIVSSTDDQFASSMSVSLTIDLSL
jgi:hypothetical protein